MNNIKAKINFFLGIGFIATAFFILFSIQDIYSQQDRYNFEKLITNQENFPLSITCVVKDKKGFVWFGTQYGLYRFDGYNFKAFTFKFGDSTSLGNNLINCIYDDDRYLWIGTIQGFDRFDKTTERFKRFNLSYINNFINEICPSSNNEVWIGTGSGLYKLDISNEKFTIYNIVPDDTSGTDIFNAVTTLFEDGNGYLWIGTGNGLYRYDIKNKIFKNYKFDPEDPNSLSDDVILKVLQDSKGNLWIATFYEGLNKFDKKTEKFKRFQHDSLNINSLADDVILSMDIDNEQKLWIATIKGVSIFEPNTNNFTNLKEEVNSNTRPYERYIYCDKNDLVWTFSTEENGFGVYNKFKWKFNYYKNFSGDKDSLTYNSVSSVCEDSFGNFWIGTNNGIDILNKRKERIRHLEHNPKDTTSISNNGILKIYKDKKNFMWIGTWDGPLDRYDADKDIFTHFYDFDRKAFTTFDIIEDKKENLWVGLRLDGLRVFDKNRTLIKKYFYINGDSSDSTQTPVFKIFEDNKENMWIGTRIGLATIDIKTDSITFYKNNPNDSNSLSANYVMGFNEDEKGNLWLGTANGLNSFDINKKTFKKYNNVKDGGRDYIFDLMKDSKGNFWSTTGDRGITMFELNDKTFTNYGLNDGLQGFRFGIGSFQYRARDGEMFFGRSKGLNSFYPDSIPQNKNIPTIVITDFRIFNKEVRLDTSVTEKKLITISYKENFFSFGFASLDYTNPERNQHAYILEGIDKDWNNVGNVRTANYTDIEPGEYTFRVKGSNNDGIWNEEGTSIKITITPPWWQSWWFKSCGAALIFMTVGYGFKKRINKIRKEKTAQEEFSKRLIESQEDERKRIASALHDTIAHDILLTKSKALLALRNLEDYEYLKNALNEISDMSSETINDVRGISYNLHPHQLERLGFSEAIESIIKEASKASEIRFNADIDNADDVISKLGEINLYRVIQEGINNIIKHSKATEAELKVIRLENQIIISISDNGCGIDLNKKSSAEGKSGFGLSGIAERVKILKGEFKIESEVNNGTVIRISVPASSKDSRG